MAPETTLNDKVFLINHPDVATALDIEPDTKRRYSFSQLEPNYSKLHELAVRANAIDEKARTAVEEELIRLATNVRLYAELTHSFRFVFSHPDFSVTDSRLKKVLNLPGEQNEFSFLDIVLQADALRTASEGLENKSADAWTPQEKEIVRLMSTLYQWSRYYHGLPFHIVPALDSRSEIWLSPWDAIMDNFRERIGREEIVYLRDMVAAYYSGQQLEFDMAARAFNAAVLKRVDEKLRGKLKLIPLEILYNRLQLFLWARILYAAAFVTVLMALLNEKRVLEKWALRVAAAGFVLHATAIILRIVLLGRPPVSNLYETFIFVGFVACLVGIIMENLGRNGLGTIVSGLGGFLFLSIAGKFAAEGDTLKMLVAVLNSNFWLGTHVLSITTGYAGVCVAGILGHVYIIQGLLRPQNKAALETTYRNLMGVLGFGLIMTFLGTNLGGIWADQSWGRFWGWDPKENGAMLIVLWCAIIFHAQVGKMIGPLGVAVGGVLGLVVVMWAWFGVNLLSVGLHSYGFTSGAAIALFAYVLCQILFLLLTVPAVKRSLSR